ncbi:acyl-CoA synthetase [Corynebacteriales bacterium D3-21]|uniref:Acyl-CoA synthetase n=2 Tax=Speluncibacter jeojiensis TaxID=2710754 RepID=A0A9X4RBT0_9ACTN|nr:acyl-CoA synthetase [Rhodococcus sp. D2-41]MDG3013085.1 acyl-CoA synthetase [Corynebacteriales bacterium D3-21]
MYRSGLIPVTRPDLGVESLLAARRFGPFVAATRHAAHQDSAAVALIDERGPMTFTELDAQSNALARAWSQRGLGPGSVIAVLCRDHRGLVLCMLAAGKTGARLVMMNTGFAGPQLADVSAREGVQALVYDSEFTELLSGIPASTPHFLAWVDPEHAVDPDIPTLDDLIANTSTDPVPVPPKPGGFVLLTSGTTGTPKGAPREHTSVFASAQFLDRVPLRTGGITYMAAPIFHGTGLSQFVLSFALGCTVIMSRRFDPEKTLRGVAEHKADALIVVPTMLQRIIDLGPEVLARYDTSALRIIFAAGSALSPDLCRRTAECFGDVLYNLYGSTEVAVATVATPEELRRAPGTAGRAPVTCRVALFNADGKPITEPHHTGRIFVASGLSFGGYTDGRHKEIIDGLLSSGDVGHFDEEGLLFVDGRDDDMIVSGGENVYPLEVENLLADRPDVLDAAVVGVPDADFGHRLRAYVVPGPDSARDGDEIKAFVKANLARYKAPREVVFIDELPRNATGKVLRKVLEQMEI